MADAYPLSWPEGWARTPKYRRKRSRYRVDLKKAVKHLHDNLAKLGALKGSIIISSNVPPMNALGVPRNDGVQVEDPGVTVWWTTKAHGERVIACDKWESVRDNVRAAGIAIEAMCNIERAGASQVLERAFSAFGALPAGEQAQTVRPWWEVLGFPHEVLEHLSIFIVEAKFRELSKRAHPDKGGSEQEFKELNQALESARQHYEGK